MDNREFSKQMEQRTKTFSLSVIKLSVQLPGTPEGKVLRNQLTKAGTSVGANYREANRARSKADFVNRIRICESEASETIYWLEIIVDLNWLNKDHIEPIIKEAHELLGIFTSIGKSSKNS